MNRRIGIVACILGCLAVMLGAFGAHFLKVSLSVTELENWKTGVNYQFYHTLALFVISNLKLRSRIINYSAVFFVLGIFFFSGSLYLLSTHSLTGLSVAIFGPITPLGGLCFIIGWLTMFLAYVRNK